MQNIEQRTEEWMNWRNQGIGASEASILMNASPYKTPLELYKEKLGLAKPMESNFAMERGNRLEPLARTQFELLMNAEFSPRLAVHDEYPHIRASLDGFNEELNAVLEIKCPGVTDHKLALEGKVPDKYIWQLEHQALVTGASKVYYYSFDGKEGAVINYTPNKDNQLKLIERINAFWFENVQKKIPPMPTDEDFVSLDSDEAKDLFTEFKKAKQSADTLNNLVDELKAKIIAKFAVHTRVKCAGVRLTRVERKGAIDYSKYLNTVGNVDLEKYRKPSSVSYTITIED